MKIIYKTTEKTNESQTVEIPKLYKVLLHNDDKTTFNFVIAVLVKVFHRTPEQAIEITNSIHNTGIGIAGQPYSKEIAEEKTLEVTRFASINGFPLKASIEEI